MLDFSKLAGAFARDTITPTDIDFGTEQNGHFLFIEIKKLGQKVSEGQRTFFTRLIGCMRGMGTVLIAEHNQPSTEQIDVASCSVYCAGVFTMHKNAVEWPLAPKKMTVREYAEFWSSRVEPENPVWPA